MAARFSEQFGERVRRVVTAVERGIITTPAATQTAIAVGGGGDTSQPRAVVTGRTSDDLRFIAKFVNSRGVPLKDKDGSELPAVEVWVDTWPPATPIGDCLQQFEVGHEIPIRYHVKYDNATDADVRRPYIDTVLIAGCAE